MKTKKQMKWNKLSFSMKQLYYTSYIKYEQHFMKMNSVLSQQALVHLGISRLPPLPWWKGRPGLATHTAPLSPLTAHSTERISASLLGSADEKISWTALNRWFRVTKFFLISSAFVWSSWQSVSSLVLVTIPSQMLLYISGFITLSEELPL